MHGPMAFRMLSPKDLDDDVQISRATLKRVYRFAKPYHRKLAFLIGVVTVSTFLEVIAPPMLMKRIVDDAITPRHLNLLYVFAGLFIAVALSQAAISIIGRWFSARIGEGLIYDLRVKLFDHVQRMPVAFFTRTQTGALISRLTSDVVGAQRVVTETIVGVVQIIISLAMALTGMFILSWELTLAALVLVPIFVLPTRKMGKLLQRLIKQQMESNAAMSSQMTERFQIGGALLVKLFGRPDKETGYFSEHAGNVRDLGIKAAMYGRVFFVSFGLVAAIGTGLAYLFGGRMVILDPQDFTLGNLLAFTALLTRLYAPVTMLSNVRVEMMTGLVSFERVFEVLDFPPAITEKPEAIDIGRPDGAIQFDEVWFKYPAGPEVSIASLEGPARVETQAKDAWVLKGVSFAVKPGEMTALVGPSGAGKTTISMLIPRMYDVVEGAVKIDGHDVRDLTLANLTSSVGVVTQDAHMFHDTMRTNLTYAKPDATDADLTEALKAAQIWDLVSSLPDGLDTMVGERGYRLSGGEKQRLAIARLLLKDPAIMILDEATAHLDSESELLIQRALAEALSGRTSVVIAHRLSTIVKADQILVIDSGKVAERGTHFDLLDGGGLYSELYRTQFETTSPAAGAPALATEAYLRNRHE